MSLCAQAPARIRVCASDELAERGQGVRFDLTVRAYRDGVRSTGFVVRVDGKVHGYLNECAHVPVELDWQQGVFFDDSRVYLTCATHGAIYVPDSGHCVGGPCRGGALRRVTVVEEKGVVYWLPDERFSAPVS